MRVLFVNSGILGHRSVAGLIEQSVAGRSALEGVHIDLSGPLSMFERAVRRALALPLTPSRGPLANVDMRRWRLEWHAGLLARRRIARALDSRPADVIHYHTQATAYASLSRLRATPSVVSIDATQQLARDEMRSPLARLSYAPNIAHDGRVFRAASAITATSAWAATSLAAHYPECASKLHVLPYPVRSTIDPAWIACRAERSARQGDRPRALFMGGDFPRKGGLDLLATWRDARLAEVLSLDLVTDWPIDAQALPAGVRVMRGVTAHTEAWYRLWREADVFVMPSRHEAFGMVYQEAAAAGLPVVATRINAVPEIVEDGVTGLLVARDDREALAAACRALASDADRRRRMGEAALARARSLFSLERYGARLEHVLRGASATRAAA